MSGRVEGDPEGRRVTRRFLVEVRGVLHVEAATGEEADRLAKEWIARVSEESAGDGKKEIADGVRVGYLRVYPESED